MEKAGQQQTPRNPFPTVDVIVELEGEKGQDMPAGSIVLIKRKNPPPGWAIPGGFVDYGESLETAAVRELKEETGLEVELICQLHTYSDPKRDPRFHTVSTVYVGRAKGVPKGADDALEAGIFTRETLPGDLAFDHARILQDYFEWREDRGDN